MNEIQAIMGLAQLGCMSEIRKKRAAIAQKYDQELSVIKGLKFPRPRAGATSNYSYYPILVESGESHDGLNFIHLEIQPDRRNRNFIIKSEISYFFGCSTIFTLGKYESTTFYGIKNFGGMKTNYGCIPIIQNASIVIPDTKSMGSIIDEPKIVPVGNILKLIHITWKSIAMNSQDSRGTFVDCFQNFGWIDIAIFRIDVNENRFTFFPYQAM